MVQEEHSAILSTFIKLPFVIKICVLSIFEWPLKTGFTIVTYFHDFFLYFIRQLDKSVKLYIFLFPYKTHVVGTQKNRLNETVLF